MYTLCEIETPIKDGPYLHMTDLVQKPVEKSFHSFFLKENCVCVHDGSINEMSQPRA